MRLLSSLLPFPQRLQKYTICYKLSAGLLNTLFPWKTGSANISLSGMGGLNEKTLLRKVMDKLFKEKGERTEEAGNCLR